jgi:hypothetical protein
MDTRPAFAALAASLAVTLAGCVGSSSTASSEGGDAPAPQSPIAVVPASAAGPTIASIRTHDGVISIASSLGGPRVTLANADGEVTLRDLTLDELRAQAPDAYRLVTTSRAFVDASIDRGLLDRGSRPEPDGARPDFGGSHSSRR